MIQVKPETQLALFLFHDSSIYYLDSVHQYQLIFMNLFSFLSI